MSVSQSTEKDLLPAPTSQTGLPPAPQAVVQTLTKAAIFLVVTINSGERQSRGHPVILRRSPGTAPGSRLPRHRRRPLLRAWVLDRTRGTGSLVNRGPLSCIPFEK